MSTVQAADSVLGESWPLVGRDHELATVARLLTAAGPGECGVVIAGDAGVGKTRLAREVVTNLATAGSWAVTHVAGTEAGGGVALAAFARWSPSTDMTPAHAIRVVLEAIAAEAREYQQVLLVADDAHLLDDLSALVLHQFVLSRMGAVVATVRSGEPAPDAIRSLWKDGHLARLELRPLTRTEMSAVLLTVLRGELGHDCEQWLWRITEGNMLFLKHVVDQELAAGRLIRDNSGVWQHSGGLIASVSLREVVAAHIGTVSPDVAEVVDLVAVSEPLERRLLIDLTSTAAVERAEAGGLIRTIRPGGGNPRGRSGDVYIGHPLYAQIRIEGSGPTRPAHMRGRIVTALTADPAAATLIDPLRLGLLWLDSDLPADPIRLLSAASLARSRLDLGNAERLARAAMNAGAGLPASMMLAYLLFMREDGVATENVLASIDSSPLAGMGFINPTILRAANQLWLLGDPQRSWDIIDEALENPGADTGHLRVFRGVQAVLAARPGDALEALELAENAIEALDPFARVLLYCARALAYADLGRPDEAAEAAEHGHALVRAAPQSSYNGTVIAEFHAQALAMAGRLDEAVKVARACFEVCGHLTGQIATMATAMLGMTLLAAGELGAAVTHLNTAYTQIGSYGRVSGIFYRFAIARVEALARAGHSAQAAGALAELEAAPHPAYRYTAPAYQRAIAWVSAMDGRLTQARQSARRGAELAAAQGQHAREVICLQTATQLGDPNWGDRLGELAAIVDGPRAPLAARYATALACGDAVGLDKVAAEFEHIGETLAAIDARAQAATAYRAAGLRGSAHTASQRAEKLAATCGAAPTPALRQSNTPLGLTSREQEIAALVARGLSNREIAAATNLSVRTVEGHVYRAAAKAGLSTRAELAALMNELDPRRDRP